MTIQKFVALKRELKKLNSLDLISKAECKRKAELEQMIEKQTGRMKSSAALDMLKYVESVI